MHSQLRCSLLLTTLLVAACEKGEKKAPATAVSVAAVEAPAPAVSDAAPPEPPPVAPGLITSWRKDMGMKNPESVLHDEVADMYLVSNVEGKPLDADGKGFISRWDPGALGGDTRWIASGKNGVTLNAPKGMAITGETLWVADIDTVRMFDRKTGKPTGEVKITGATSLNDMAVANDGRVLVSDMGVKGADFEASGTDAVHVVGKDKKVTTIAKGAELGHPNGLLVVDGKIWVATYGSGEIYSLGAGGAKGDLQKPPKGMLGGLAMFGNDLLVSSWDGKAIYRGKPGATMSVILEGVKAPSDFTIDKKRKRLLVPLMEDDEVRAYTLE